MDTYSDNILIDYFRISIQVIFLKCHFFPFYSYYFSLFIFFFQKNYAEETSNTVVNRRYYSGYSNLTCDLKNKYMSNASLINVRFAIDFWQINLFRKQCFI